jgi:hypothetical protein
MPAIAPPPTRADTQPPTIALDQTNAKDMKITFTNGTINNVKLRVCASEVVRGPGRGMRIR